MTIGEKIQKQRKDLGISQEELAQKLLVSRQTISQWEKGQTVPTIDNLLRLKDVFGISADEILNGDEKPETKLNTNSLDTICAALTYAMGVEPPKQAAPANYELTNYIDKMFGGKKADRVFMYNPDAVAQWIMEKYPEFLKEVTEKTELRVPLRSVMPSVTPVCFGTMYTGAQPEVHGIQAYEKPVITIDTIFDALIRAGKKPVIVVCGQASLGKIYLNRDMDYVVIENGKQGNVAPANAAVAQMIMEDKYDFYVVYNGNYDAVMHRCGPEDPRTLAELRINSHVFSWFSHMIEKHWKHHRTLIGFAMDHGCHEIDGGCGSHGLDMPEDLNIVHMYKAIKGENAE